MHLTVKGWTGRTVVARKAGEGSADGQNQTVTAEGTVTFDGNILS